MDFSQKDGKKSKKSQEKATTPQPATTSKFQPSLLNPAHPSQAQSVISPATKNTSIPARKEFTVEDDDELEIESPAREQPKTPLEQTLQERLSPPVGKLPASQQLGSVGSLRKTRSAVPQLPVRDLLTALNQENTPEKRKRSDPAETEWPETEQVPIAEYERRAPVLQIARRQTIQPKDSPLCREILEEMMERIKIPTGRYDGTTDPEDHCTTFEQHMMMYTDSDAMWCKASFLSRFVSKQKRKKSSGELMSFAQRDREPLRDYLTRFNNESITIPNLQQEVAVLALMRGMQECEFKKYLSRKSYTNLGDILHKANEYIRGDEMMKISNVVVATGGNVGYNPGYNPQAEKGGNNFHQSNNQQGAGQRNQNNRNVNPQGQRSRQDRRESRGLFDNYTPLNTPRTAIYNINNKMDGWRRPPPMQSRERNVKKFCDFHNEHGHLTEDCRDLKDNIEDMVRKGYFSQYRARQGNGNNNSVGGNPTNSYRPQQQNQQQYPRIEQPYQPPRIEQKQPETSARAEQRDGGKKPPVYVISGGPVHGGTISGASRSLEEHRQMVNYHNTRVWPNPPSIPVMTFSESDCRGIIFPHDDPLVLTIDIANADVNRVLVDGGSSENIIFWEAFKQLHIPEDELQRVNYPVIGFSGSTVYPEGSIRLPVKIGEGSEMRDLMVDFLIIKVPAVYNVIIGRPFIHDVQAVVSTYHLTMIYMSNLERPAKIRGSQLAARSCYLTALRTPGRMVPEVNLTTEPARQEVHLTTKPARQEQLPKRKSCTKRGRTDLNMEHFDERPVSAPRPMPDGLTENIELEVGNMDRTVVIGTEMGSDMKVNLISLLREHADIFAFSADEMPDIDPEIMVHRLNADRNVRPVRQKKRNFSTEKMTAIQEEVDKLLAAGFIEPCDYPEWLANVVMVKKSSGSWRMCVDFTNLNRACPKDFYPLPRIDRLVDSTSGHAMLSFLDAFSGYHQVSLHKSDRKKATFITDAGVFCYKAMPFGLKNAGATYQRLVDKVFADQKGRNVEVYVDDSIVKSRKEEDHVSDLRETFETLRKYRMKLNPKKCVFGVRSGKFLGCLVSERGIDANPEKVEAIISLPQPKSVKDIQRLTGKMAALNRFVSKSADKQMPFFTTLRQNKKFKWGPAEQEAFEALKSHLKNLPTIARAKEGGKLQLYISASPKTVAAVLVAETENKGQQPVYFVSHVLNGPETRYTLVEKMAYAVLIAARKLRPYFDMHTIEVLTNFPLEKAISKLDTSGRLLKWAIELSEFDLEFRPRTAIKAQALADFIVEASYQEDEVQAEVWDVSVDGSAAQTGSGAGIIMKSPTGDIFEYAIKFMFNASNNEAEYEAAIAGIQMCLAADAKRVILTTDSQLVASQFSGEYEAKEPSMVKYLEKLRSVSAQLEKFSINLVPRAENTLADALSKLASSNVADLKRTVMMEVMNKRSTESEVIRVMAITTTSEWYDNIQTYIQTGALPADLAEAKKTKRDSVWYIILWGRLYKKSFSLPFLRCLTAFESARLIEEMHEGTRGNHAGGKPLAIICQRQGYYWPTMLEDCRAYVKKCEKCQKFSAVINLPANDLMPILNPIPFAQWGMDIVGPFPMAAGGRKFLIIAVDYFTKWIEAEPVAKITANQSNGQAEAANKQILAALKKKLEDCKGKWADLMPEILWCNRTAIKEATGESPFKLSFGSEAVIPAEMALPTMRIQHYDEERNDQLLRHQLDFMPEIRMKAEISSAAYKSRMSRAYNKKVKHRPLGVGDLVLRRTAATGKGNAQGKLTANWEGPYQIWEEIVPGSYRLMQMDGTALKNSWNASTLRKYYV
ncbi:uncharacterized protein [Spinacia oleracea]|uniref:Uncharacterized protein n=1 Tax=Spinacia oleracea TaxID=3562 RepID=A0ABM3QZD2_SPIOL|nr:uncharacterized protein LOC110794394 [Spinacia oleracea]